MSDFGDVYINNDDGSVTLRRHDTGSAEQMSGAKFVNIDVSINDSPAISP